MMHPREEAFHVAIACGGTGGHLFPGLAVAGELAQRGCKITLLVSPKDVDQQAARNIQGMEVVTLPAVGLQGRNYLSFASGFLRSYQTSKKLFNSNPPHAVLAMGGFTSAPPVLAGRSLGAKTFLHESNTVPGRANRWLARFVDMGFVGFPQASSKLRARRTIVTGTPVRSQFRSRDAATCRSALGLDANRPVVLVMGGSQGASGINEMILSALPQLGDRVKNWQWLHLAGIKESHKVQHSYKLAGAKAVVYPFLAEMDLALGAATACVSRAGASSLAEIAAMRLPSLLVPYPPAADNHQFFNAQAFAETGAALVIEQNVATPEKVDDHLLELMENSSKRNKMQAALAEWDAPKAAEQIAQQILELVTSCDAKKSNQVRCSPGHSHHRESKVIA